jgi:hypothetical protein
MNIGLLLGLNVYALTEDFTVDLWYDDGYGGYGYILADTSSSYTGFSFSFGGKAGAEIMAGPHVGFPVEFIFRYSSFSTRKENVWDYLYTDVATVDITRHVTLPMVALGLGVNFYF